MSHTLKDFRVALAALGVEERLSREWGPGTEYLVRVDADGLSRFCPMPPLADSQAVDRETVRYVLRRLGLDEDEPFWDDESASQ